MLQPASQCHRTLKLAGKQASAIEVPNAAEFITRQQTFTRGMETKRRAQMQLQVNFCQKQQ